MSPISVGSRAPYLVFALLTLILQLSAPRAQAAQPGYLGVHLQELDSSMAKALQLDDESGVLISEVVEDGPAAKAGLEDGDVILGFDGKDIGTTSDLMKAVRKSEAGDEVELKILRGGKEKSFDVTLGEREENEFVWSTHSKHGKILEGDDGVHAYRWHHDGDGDIDIEMMLPHGENFPGGKNFFVIGGDDDRGFLGVHLDDLGEQMAEYFGVDGGVLVTEVVEDSPASEAGLKAGDVITKLDGEEIADAGALHEWMAGTEAEQKIKVEVRRKGDRKSFDVTLGEAPERDIMANVKVFGDDGHFNVKAPKILMKKLHGDGNAFFHDGDGEEHSIVIERHGEDMDELREELKELKKELKKIQEELKK